MTRQILYIRPIDNGNPDRADHDRERNKQGSSSHPWTLGNSIAPGKLHPGEIMSEEEVKSVGVMLHCLFQRSIKRSVEETEKWEIRTGTTGRDWRKSV